MSAVHGRVTSVLFNEFDLSGFLKSHDAKLVAPEIDVTPYQALGKKFIAGFKDGTLTMEGFFETDETDEDRLDDVLQAAIGAASPNVVTVSPEGALTTGKRSLLVDAVETEVNVDDPTDGAVMNQATFRGGITSGVVLAPLAAVTATGNGTSHDNGAATSNGGVAHQHVTAASGTTPTNDSIVQDSDDNSAWVDLITFTQKTDVGSERAVVTGTVERYVRARHVIGGTGPSFTQAISFARF